ncbi:MAG: HAD family phosphatase [Chlamydiia bacterium]|nr:HAD family phosphatase [Chlamydiia bacterium]
MKALLCIDLDGTLVDSLTYLRGVYFHFLRSYGYEGSEREFMELNGPAIAEVVEILKGRYRLEPAYDKLLAHYRYLITEEVPKLFPDAKEVLSHFVERGLTLALVTSAEAGYVDHIFNHHQLKEMFTYFITPDDCRGKPAPDLYLKALEKAAMPVEKSLAIEDSPNGMQAALAAGMQAIYFQGSWRDVEKGVKEWYAQL